MRLSITSILFFLSCIQNTLLLRSGSTPSNNSFLSAWRMFTQMHSNALWFFLFYITFFTQGKVLQLENILCKNHPLHHPLQELYRSVTVYLRVLTWFCCYFVGASLCSLSYLTFKIYVHLFFYGLILYSLLLDEELDRSRTVNGSSHGDQISRKHKGTNDILF